MLSHELLFAAVLIVSPPDSVSLTDAQPLHAALNSPLRALALKWELMDHREVDFLLANAQEFDSDLRLLQGRCHELAGAPLLCEAKRLPDRTTISDLMAFNRSYRDSLTSRLAVDKIHAEELQEAVRETDQLYQIWDTARDARCEYYFVSYRRQALQQLRDLVGAESFYQGQLPPNIPWWRIPIVD